MSVFARNVSAFSSVYGLSFAERVRLVSHYPLFKLAYWARYRTGVRRLVGRRLISMFSGYELSQELTREGGRAVPVPIGFDLGALSSFEEVFWGEAYDVPFPLREIRTYVDLGANTGTAFLYFALRCPRLSRAVLVEPNAVLARRLRKLVATVPDIDSEVEEVCVSGEPGAHVSLVNSAAHDHRHSRIHGAGHARLAASESVLAVVKNVSLTAVLDKAGLRRVDLVKMDIEGAETSLLERDPEAFSRVDRLCVELHGSREERQAQISLLEATGLSVQARRAGGEVSEVCFATSRMLAV